MINVGGLIDFDHHSVFHSGHLDKMAVTVGQVLSIDYKLFCLAFKGDMDDQFAAFDLTSDVGFGLTTTAIFIRNG